MNAMFDIRQYEFNPYSLTYLIAGLIILAEAAFVYLQNKTAPLNRGFVLVTVLAGIWQTGVFFIFSAQDYGLSLAWSKYYTWFGIIFISPSLYLYSAIWRGLDISKKANGFILNFTIAAVYYAVCISTPHIISGLWEFSWGRYPKAGLYHPAFLLWFGCMLYMSFYNFLKAYHETDRPVRKKQTMLVTVAFVFGAIMGSVDFIGNYGVKLYGIGSIAITIFSTIIAYSIVSYKLMDIETVLHKTLLWMMSFAVIAVPFMFFYHSAMPYLQGSLPLQFVFGLINFIIFAMYFRFVQPNIDHIFQRRRANLEDISQQFADDLVHLEGMDDLVARIEETVSQAVYPEWVGILIYDEEKMGYVIKNDTDKTVPEWFDEEDKFLRWLPGKKKILSRQYIESDPDFDPVRDLARGYFEMTGAQVAVPLVLNDKLLGIINLGRKSNLKRYSAVDFQFLTTIGNQSAVSVSNSLIYENIEQQVKERTDELVEVQKQLVQAEKLATVGTLSGGVAHEINNPLTAILTNVQILLMTASDAEDKESLQLIEEATLRCRGIVQKLMDYSKKPTENEGYVRIDAVDAVRKVVNFLKYQLEQENISLKTDLQGEPGYIIGNYNEIEQVITNILLNARDAIKEHKKTGEISLIVECDDTNIIVRISDEGKGVPAEIRSKIFDPFFTTKDVGKGLGLGLSICQSIIEKHKGKLSMRSEPGQGAEFVVILPAAPDKNTE